VRPGFHFGVKDWIGFWTKKRKKTSIVVVVEVVITRTTNVYHKRHRLYYVVSGLINSPTGAMFEMVVECSLVTVTIWFLKPKLNCLCH
jgi:hypothetical protein